MTLRQREAGFSLRLTACDRYLSPIVWVMG